MPRLSCLLTALLLSTGPLGSARAEPAVELRLAFGGDVYLDAPARVNVERLAEEVGRPAAFRELLAGVAPTLRAADLAMVNLETPVAARLHERAPGEPPVFSAPPVLLEALAGAGVDVVTLANNHVYDQGHAGLAETLSAARQSKLAVVGAAPEGAEASGPLPLSTPAGTVALCTWTQSLNVRPYDEEEAARAGGLVRVSLVRDETIRRCVVEARARADLVVAVFHWTPSDWRGPREEEQRLVQEAVDAGAALVVGHGPHVPGPTRWVLSSTGERRALVLYSLGNLVGAMGGESDLWRTFRAGVRDAPVVVVRARRGAGGRLVPVGFEVAPFWIADPMPPSAQWPSGQPLSRPLSVEREVERLDAARCGAACLHLARGFRRRAALLRQALAAEDGLLQLDATGADAAAPAPSPPEGLGALFAGVELPLRFPSNQVEPEVTDLGALDRLAAVLNSRRDLQVRLIGTARAGEGALPAELLGARRARAVMWLLTSRGPSRSRFLVEGGAAAAEARVVLRLVGQEGR